MPEKPSPRAEIIAIGDELTSGQRLDTNSRWLSQRLDEMGVDVRFHTCVGDSQIDIERAFEIASTRADIMLATGGLGPTLDDLTRQAIAAVLRAPLELHAPSLQHIEAIFHRHGRQMPERNRVQALLPAGASPIDNPEGTAPGIAFSISRPDSQQPCRGWALPGVPAEMKQMWHASVAPELRSMFSLDRVTIHRTLRCFGAGESEVEARLQDLTRRDRYPLVGITASQAVISLRVTASARSEDEAQAQIAPTIALIRERLGEWVFGEDDDTLESVVAGLLRRRGQQLAILDYWLGGRVAAAIAATDDGPDVLRASLAFAHRAVADSHVETAGPRDETMGSRGETAASRDEATGTGGETSQARSAFGSTAAWSSSPPRDSDHLMSAAARLGELFPADWVVAIAPPRTSYHDDHDRQTFDVYLGGMHDDRLETFLVGGHSAYRRIRCQKQVLNAIRLALLQNH